MSGPFGASQFMYATASGFYPFEISNSLRFDNASNQNLVFTPSSAGNLRAWTLSMWVKRGNISDQDHNIFSANAEDNFRFMADDTFNGNMYSSVRSAQYANFDTSSVYRDGSAWYNIVYSWDSNNGTAANRLRLFVNGVNQTSLSGDNSYPNQNTDSTTNLAISHAIGKQANSTARNFDGYIAEVNFIDGTTHDASSFGELKNDIWIPKNTSGLTFGSQGYRLQFKQTGTGANASGVGADTSGNANHFTPTNITASDVVPDSPTNNFATYNAVMRANMTFSEGNLKALGVGNNYDNISGTIAFDPTDSRGYYWEWYVVAHDDDTEIGIAKSDNVNFNQSDASNPTAHSSDTPSYRGSGQKKVANSNSDYGTAWDNGNILSVAVKSGSVFFYHNGTLQASGTAATTGLTGMWVPSFSINGTQSGIVNFGQDGSFGGNVTAQGNADANGKGDFYYAPPAGYVALCTANLPAPVATIDPNEGGSPQDYFSADIFTGNGTNQDIDTGFDPDLVWTRQRTDASGGAWMDRLRDHDAYFQTANSNAEGNFANITFVTDGYNVAGNSNLDNENAHNYVGWAWKAGGDGSANEDGDLNTTETSVASHNGFSISLYTGTGSSTTVGHGLGGVPDLIIIKRRNSAREWYVYNSINAGDGYLYLQSTAALETDSNRHDRIGNTSSYVAPTSSVITLGTSGDVNGSSDTYVMYCFRNIDGLQKIGKYTGNGNANGPFIYTGFRPEMVIVKNIDSAGNSWHVMDTARNTFNLVDNFIFPNSATAEDADSNTNFDLLSNGFKLRATSQNDSGDNFIYIAFAEQPFKYANAR